MSETKEKKIVGINLLALIIFDFLKEYWGGTHPNEKPPMDIDEINFLIQPHLKELRPDRPVDTQQLRNNLLNMVRLEILERQVKLANENEKRKVRYILNWKLLRKIEVVDNAGICKKGFQSKNASPSKLKIEKIVIPRTPLPEKTEGFCDQYPPETKAPRLRIMCAIPDLRTNVLKDPSKHPIEENFQEHFKLLCTKKSKWGLKDFEGSAPNCALRHMFFGEESFLEGMVRENDGKIEALLIAQGLMDCTLWNEKMNNGEGEEMKIGHAYMIEPNIP